MNCSVPSCCSMDYTAEQEMEIEALQAILMEDLKGEGRVCGLFSLGMPLRSFIYSINAGMEGRP